MRLSAKRRRTGAIIRSKPSRSLAFLGAWYPASLVQTEKRPSDAPRPELERSLERLERLVMLGAAIRREYPDTTRRDAIAFLEHERERERGILEPVEPGPELVALSIMLAALERVSSSPWRVRCALWSDQ